MCGGVGSSGVHLPTAVCSLPPPVPLGGLSVLMCCGCCGVDMWLRFVLIFSLPSSSSVKMGVLSSSGLLSLGLCFLPWAWAAARVREYALGCG